MAQTFQIGANTSTNDSISIAALDLTANADIVAILGAGTSPFPALIDNTADFATVGTVIDNIDLALNTISNTRATYGAIQSRFDARDRQPADLGREPDRRPQPHHGRRLRPGNLAMMSRASILQQAGNAMVAQANQLPQQVLFAAAIAKISRSGPQVPLDRADSPGTIGLLPLTVAIAMATISSAGIGSGLDVEPGGQARRCRTHPITQIAKRTDGLKTRAVHLRQGAKRAVFTA